MISIYMILYINKNKWSEVWLSDSLAGWLTDFSTINYTISTCELSSTLVSKARAELRWPTDMVGRPVC